MSKLVKCIECNHDISTTADRCPRCGSDYPHGVKCAICHDQAKHSKVMHANGYSFNFYEDYYYHPECLEQLMSIPDGTNCSACNLIINNSLIPINDIPEDNHKSQRWWPSCPNCGEVYVLKGPVSTCYGGYSSHQFCRLCSLPIYGFHRYEKYPYEVERYAEQKFCHEYCAQKNKVVAESIERYKEYEKKAEREKNTEICRTAQNGGCLGSIVLFIAALGSLMLLR